MLILGAGYACLAFLKALPASVLKTHHFTLISESPLHYFSVLLHEVAAGVQEQHVLKLSSILPTGVEFIEDHILEIKADGVVGQKDTYAYTKLIVGLGFASDSFGVPGVKEHAKTLTNYQGCQQVHQELLKAIQVYKKNPKEHFSVVVCGGGFSAIEFLGALTDTLPKIFEGHGLNPQELKLTCLEAMPKILPMFSDALVQKGVVYLQDLGVHLEVGAKILECQPDRVIVEKNQERQEVLADFIVWTCGVRGNPVIENSPFFKSARSKVEVNTFFEPLGLENQGVFVLGDCAALKNPEGKFYPPTAQLASQMGAHLGVQFEYILQGKGMPFKFKPKGTICSLGAHYAIGHVGPFNISGKLAVWLKKYIEWCWKRQLEKM